MNHFEEFIQSTKEVFRECSLSNGAIVAANSDSPLYPKNVQNYRYVWPRDASYICVAAKLIGITTIQRPFFSWVLDRAEEFSDSGLLYQNYYPNGPKRWLAFQPDQSGTLLWAIHNFYHEDISQAREFGNLITKAADGLCNVWHKNHFTILTQDLWEESYTYPEIETTHTYSLAACACGLELASQIIPNQRWLKTAKEMRERLALSFHKYFFRTEGMLLDSTVDASMVGLAYPFKIYPFNNPRMKATVAQIERRLSGKEGVHRYENDYYGGYRRQGINTRRGGGCWPIATFWLSIYNALADRKTKAMSLFNSVLARAPDRYFPEQVFDNGIQVSVKPLAWSHAMFVLAAKELGLLR
jgi:glucoamylase